MQGKRIGLHCLGNNPQVDSLVQQSVRLFKTAGATVIEIDEIAPKEQDKILFKLCCMNTKQG